MSGHPGRPETQVRRRDRRVVRSVRSARRTRTYPIRQRTRVRRQGGAGLDRSRRAKTAYIERGSPWENGFIESFNARLRYELLDGEIFYSLAEARIVIESWRRHYNTERPHGSLGYKPPAPEVFIPAFAAR